MLQFKKVGAALAIFIALNAVLYQWSWIDNRIIPQKGNVLHGFIFREAVRSGSGANIVRAAQAGNITAAQVIKSHPAEFGLQN